jgi:ribonuclease HI
MVIASATSIWTPIVDLELLLMAIKKKYYAVAVGRVPGIYQKWYEAGGAHAQVDGFPGAVYKGFTTRGEAEAFMKSIHKRYPVKRKKPPSSVEPEIGKPEAGRVIIYTDGGALGNPGPGGFGVVICTEKGQMEYSGGFRMTTNNRMELTACIEAFRKLRINSMGTLYSDSRYVVDGIKKGWARAWRKNQWIKSDGKPAINQDLWEALLSLVERHGVSFVWVRGHSGNPGNERCDHLAVQAASGGNLSADTVYEKLRDSGASKRKTAPIYKK